MKHWQDFRHVCFSKYSYVHVFSLISQVMIMAYRCDTPGVYVTGGETCYSQSGLALF